MFDKGPGCMKDRLTSAGRSLTRDPNLFELQLGLRTSDTNHARTERETRTHGPRASNPSKREYPSAQQFHNAFSTKGSLWWNERRKKRA